MTWFVLQGRIHELGEVPTRDQSVFHVWPGWPRRGRPAEGHGQGQRYWRGYVSGSSPTGVIGLYLQSVMTMIMIGYSVFPSKSLPSYPYELTKKAPNCLNDVSFPSFWTIYRVLCNLRLHENKHSWIEDTFMREPLLVWSHFHYFLYFCFRAERWRHTVEADHYIPRRRTGALQAYEVTSKQTNKQIHSHFVNWTPSSTDHYIYPENFNRLCDCLHLHWIRFWNVLGLRKYLFMYSYIQYIHVFGM